MIACLSMNLGPRQKEQMAPVRRQARPDSYFIWRKFQWEVSCKFVAKTTGRCCSVSA